MENQNPAPPVSNPSQSVIPDSVGNPESNSNTPDSNAIEKTAKFSLKAIVSILIFLLLVGGAAAGFVYREPLMSLVSKPTPTPAQKSLFPFTPPANWKQYTNTKIGYSLKYPEEFTVKQAENYTTFSDKNSGPFEGVTIMKVTEKKELSDEEFSDYSMWDCNSKFKSIEEGVSKGKRCLTFHEKITIDNREVDFTGYSHKAGGDYLVEVRLDKIHHLQINAVHTVTLELFKKILTTFKFTEAIPPSPTQKCIVGGCSGQICQDASEEPAITTCEYREEYACYKSATCEVQANGECGWTETEELKQCLEGN